MSGSPRLPPKPNQEAGERGQGSFQTQSQDAFNTSTTMSSVEYRTAPPQPPLPPPPHPGIRPFALESQERVPYPYRRPEGAIARPISYAPHIGQMLPQAQYPMPPVAGSSLRPSPYSTSTSMQQSPEAPSITSPKSQRKTKGHVASACVPCKRAHLRCDAQRPCSRCLSNGKEDACVDVVHKKRGRPRLRDDREPKFDTARFTHPGESTIRRPAPLFSPVGAAAPPFDDPIRRSQSYRVLKSHADEPVTPRFPERGSATEANIYSAHFSMPSRSPEPAAFLTTDLEIAKASSSFQDAVGNSAILGRNLADVVSASERDRVLALQRALQEEQGRKEPSYLPPIFGKQEAEKVFQALSFDAESLSRFQLDRQDYFTFITGDGVQRPSPIRIGLAKEDSIYFVVLLLIPAPRSFVQQSPSSQMRDLAYSFQPGQGFSQLTPVSSSFDPGRPRYGESTQESGYLPRQLGAVAPLMPGFSPVAIQNAPTYSTSTPTRIEHPSGLSHSIPRSELAPGRPSQPPRYQLPPIQSQPRAGTVVDPSSQRDDRTSRVDIGGLIDKPGTSQSGP